MSRCYSVGMLKLRELTLISLLLFAVVVGCSSSDQAVIDENVDLVAGSIVRD